MKGPSLNVTSTVTGSTVRNELYGTNKSSLKRSSAAAQPYRIQAMSDQTLLISYTHRDEIYSDSKQRMQSSINRRKRVRINSPTPYDGPSAYECPSQHDETLNISSKSKISSIRISK